MSKIICKYCGSADNYTKTKQKFKDGSIHIKATCRDCDRHIKYLPKSEARTYIPFGKYKGNHTYQITDLEYLKWFKTIVKDDRLAKGITNRISELTSGCGNG